MKQWHDYIYDHNANLIDPILKRKLAIDGLCAPMCVDYMLHNQYQNISNEFLPLIPYFESYITPPQNNDWDIKIWRIIFYCFIGDYLFRNILQESKNLDNFNLSPSTYLYIKIFLYAPFSNSLHHHVVVSKKLKDNMNLINPNNMAKVSAPPEKIMEAFNKDISNNFPKQFWQCSGFNIYCITAEREPDINFFLKSTVSFIQKINFIAEKLKKRKVSIDRYSSNLGHAICLYMYFKIAFKFKIHKSNLNNEEKYKFSFKKHLGLDLVKDKFERLLVFSKLFEFKANIKYTAFNEELLSNRTGTLPKNPQHYKEQIELYSKNNRLYVRLYDFSKFLTDNFKTIGEQCQTHGYTKVLQNQFDVYCQTILSSLSFKDKVKLYIYDIQSNIECFLYKTIHYFSTSLPNLIKSMFNLNK